MSKVTRSARSSFTLSMNAVLSGFERVLIGHDPDPAYETILDFRNGEVLTRRDLTESMLVVASVNKGKTSLLRTPARAMLRISTTACAKHAARAL